MKGIGYPITNRPNGTMFLDENQLNLVSGVSTKVLIDHIVGNFIDGIEDTGNNEITPLVAGFYLCIAQVTFTEVVADKLYELKMEGGPRTMWDRKHSRTTDDLTLRCVEVMYIQADEHLHMAAVQNSGANTVDILGSVADTPGYTQLTMQRIR